MLAVLVRGSSTNQPKPPFPPGRRLTARRLGPRWLTRRSGIKDRRWVTDRHLFVCTNARSAGKPACGPRGGDALIAEIQRRLIERAAPDVLVTPCGCLGPCFDGPNAVIYPDAVWYAELEPADAAAIAVHLIDGVPLAAKISLRPGAATRAP